MARATWLAAAPASITCTPKAVPALSYQDTAMKLPTFQATAMLPLASMATVGVICGVPVSTLPSSPSSRLVPATVTLAVRVPLASNTSSLMWASASTRPSTPGKYSKYATAKRPSPLPAAAAP